MNQHDIKIAWLDDLSCRIRFYESFAARKRVDLKGVWAKIENRREACSKRILRSPKKLLEKMKLRSPKNKIHRKYVEAA